MEIRTLYKYEREAGKITVSPEKPNAEYTEVFRIIADEGKNVTNDNENFYAVVDTDTADGWHEVDAQEEAATEEDYIHSLEEMGVSFDE